MFFRQTSALLCAAMLLAHASFAAEAGVLEVQEQRISTHDGRGFTADVGTFTVPENRADPHSNIITLSVMRVKSLNPDAGPPIFILAGGPGGSSIANLLDYLGISDYLLELGDLVAVDQRGVGRSRPVLSRRFTRELPLDEPVTRDEMVAAYCEVIEESKAYWREQGVDLAGYTTAEAADDIDAVREALGYPTMRLFGRSYGSHLGLSILRRHGANVASAVLQGIEGPDHTFKTPKQIERGLEDLDALVDRDKALNEEIPSFLSLVRRVLKKFKKGPIPVEVDLGEKLGVRTVAVSKFDVQYWTANSLGRTSSLADVPAVYYAMAHDDFSTVAKFAADLRTVAVVSAMAAVTDCASGLSAARRETIAREAKRAVLGDTVNFPYPDVCDCWGMPDLGSEFRGPLKSGVPVLLICGAYDSRTPIANALELIPDLPNSRLVVVRNAGHDPRLFTSPKAVAAAIAFFRDGTVESEIIDMPEIRFTPLGSYE